MAKTTTKGLTDLQKLTNVYDELGIKYHKLESGGYTYIQKFAAHDKEGYINVFGYGLVALKDPEQLDSFMEFDKKGKIASW